VIYKTGGNNGQYDPTLTDVPQPEPSHERDDLEAHRGNGIIEGNRRGQDGIRRVFLRRGANPGLNFYACFRARLKVRLVLARLRLNTKPGRAFG
jgi:hypothetical protein